MWQPTLTFIWASWTPSISGEILHPFSSSQSTPNFPHQTLIVVWMPLKVNYTNLWNLDICMLSHLCLRCLTSLVAPLSSNSKSFGMEDWKTAFSKPLPPWFLIDEVKECSGLFIGPICIAQTCWSHRECLLYTGMAVEVRIIWKSDDNDTSRDALVVLLDGKTITEQALIANM